MQREMQDHSNNITTDESIFMALHHKNSSLKIFILMTLIINVVYRFNILYNFIGIHLY